MKYSVGIDIGGTFTDCVAIDEAGVITIGKASSTPPNFDRGFMDAIGVVASSLGRTVEDFLPDVEALLHGCTVGTNALVQGRTAKTGLIATAGHSDTIFVMSGGGRLTNQSADYIAHVAAHQKPPPLVPRSLVREVNERVAYDGTILAKLDDDQVRSVVQELIDAGVNAFAVSLLWSVANESHERRIGQIIREMAPGAFVSLASDMISRIGEYERTVAAVVNSLIGPEMTSYLSRTRQALSEAGFNRELGIMTCSGGLVDSSFAEQRPILTIGSGPVAGVVGSRTLALRGDTAPAGSDSSVPLSIITADMGGTTLDVGMLAEGVPTTRSNSWFGQFEYYVPTIDVRSVGAGGGSIIHRHESTGTIRVGPESAGAYPGPVSFGRGGKAPTVTDADVVLGYLNPDYFLHGGIPLDVEAARAALAEVGEPLGMSADEVAAAAVRIVDNHMADEIRLLSIHEGHDPRDFSVFGYGGNGAVHATAFARELGVRQVVIPLGDLASGFSALGVAASDFLVVEETSAVMTYPFDLDRLNAGWQRLESSALDRMAAQGVKSGDVRFERGAEMRYNQQVHELYINAPDGYYTQETADQLAAEFERAYARTYGDTSLMMGQYYDIITLVVKARAPQRAVDIGRGGEATTGQPARKGERGVIWYELGAERVQTPTYDGDSFVAGMSVEGPAIVEYPDTTLVVRPNQEARVSETGSVVVEINVEERQS